MFVRSRESNRCFCHWPAGAQARVGELGRAWSGNRPQEEYVTQKRVNACKATAVGWSGEAFIMPGGIAHNYFQDSRTPGALGITRLMLVSRLGARGPFSVLRVHYCAL